MIGLGSDKNATFWPFSLSWRNWPIWAQCKWNLSDARGNSAKDPGIEFLKHNQELKQEWCMHASSIPKTYIFNFSVPTLFMLAVLRWLQCPNPGIWNLNRLIDESVFSSIWYLHTEQPFHWGYLGSWLKSPINSWTDWQPGQKHPGIVGRTQVFLTPWRVSLELRYESSTLILYKELSSSIFQSCEWVSESVRHR